MLALVPFKVLQRILVILPKLPDDILTHVTIIFLHLASDAELVLRGYRRHLSTLPHQIEHELGDIATSNGDMFDRAPNDVPLGTGDDVSDTVPGVDDSSSECAIGDAVGGPRRGEGEDGLHGNVQPLDIERLEEDLGRLLSVLRRIEGGFGLQQRTNIATLYKW